MKIHAEYQWTDYLEGLRLHMQRRRRIVLILLLASVSVALVVLISGFERKTLLPPIAGLIGGLLFLQSFYGLYLPYRAKRIFKQQKSLHQPFTVEVTSEGLNWSSSAGDSQMPWSFFSTWRENQQVFLIYQADVMFHMVPTRAFRSHTDLDSFRDSLEWHIPRG